MAKKRPDMKKEIDKLLKKYEPTLKKTGEQLSRAMKTAEKDIAKMYKLAQIHVEMQMKNIEKEKLYYDIGKAVSARIEKDELDIPGLEKYKKRLGKIRSEGEKMRKALSKAGKSGKKKSAGK